MPPSQRKLGRGANRATVEAQFNRADMLLQEVVADLVNGVSRNDIILKFKSQMYENQKKPIGEKQAVNYIQSAYQILQENRIKETNKLRDQLYNQYLMLFNDCVVDGNAMTAKQILDSIAKTFLPDERTVSLQGNINNNIVVDFNFIDEEEEQEEDECDI